MALLELADNPDDLVKIVWLRVDQLGRRVIDKLAAYLAEFAPEAGWAVIDDLGGVRMRVPALDLDLDLEPERAPLIQPTSRPTLFSDLNSWMLKLLLMRKAPDWAWTATRAAPRNAHDLHGIADVSAATAHRFVKAMTAADYLRGDRRGLHLVRVESLLTGWRADYQNKPPLSFEVRPLFELELDDLAGSNLADQLIVGGLDAAEHYELQHATHGRRRLWVESALEPALEQLELVRAKPGSGVIWVGHPKYPESMRRARVSGDRATFVDPCELMLESSLDPVGGIEQSDYILERLLEWHERND